MKIPILLIQFILLVVLPVYADRGIAVKSQRTALVIGNSDYAKAPLRNPVNDATDMASALRDSGFQVTLELNADMPTMEEAIKTFGKELRSGGTGLFYYAGHGIQLRGINYLIPIGSDIETEADVKYEAVNANRVLSQMQEAGNKLNMVFLDACRNNPFARSFRSADKGLAPMEAPKGSLVSYATAPGDVAADGKGRNGIFTKNLLEQIRTPGLELMQMMKYVRRGVQDETMDKQTPFEVSSLTGDFYFFTGGGAVNVSVQPTSVKTALQDPENEMWQLVTSTTEPDDINEFLNTFPNGRFAPVARLLLARLTEQKFVNMQTTFADFFDDNSTNWLTKNTEDYRFEITNGQYMLESRKGGNWFASVPVRIDQKSDFRIECTAEKLSGTNEYGFGLVWGLKDPNNRYEILIAGNGKYAIFQIKAGEHVGINTGEQFLISKHINKNNSRNKLSLQKTGNDIQFFINDNLVDRIPFRSFCGPFVGFIIYSGENRIKIAFDNLIIQQNIE